MTPFSGIGYSLEVHPDIDQFRRQLSLVQDAGFTHVEVDPRPGYLWVGGKTIGANLATLIQTLAEYRDHLRFTLHGPYDINSFDCGRQATHRRLLDSTVEVAREIGAEAVVVHPGRRTLALDTGTPPMRDLLEREREWLHDAAVKLDGSGCALALENWLPEKPDDYSYSFWPEQLAAHVESVEHSGVGICLDVGHLFLASTWLGFDFIKGADRISSLVRHIHLQDLFANPAPRGVPELGAGDLHLPPGWGEIPLEELFQRVSFPQSPVLIAELIPAAFLPHLNAVAASCHALTRVSPVVDNTADDNRYREGVSAFPSPGLLRENY